MRGAHMFLEAADDGGEAILPRIPRTKEAGYSDYALQVGDPGSKGCFGS